MTKSFLFSVYYVTVCIFSHFILFARVSFLCVYFLIDLISAKFLLQTSFPNKNKEYTYVSTMTKTLLFSEYYVTVCVFSHFHIVSAYYVAVFPLCVYICMSMRHLCSLCFYTGVPALCAVF